MKTSHILIGIGAAVVGVYAYRKLTATKVNPTPAEQSVVGFMSGAFDAVRKSATSVKDTLAGYVKPSAPEPSSGGGVLETANQTATARRVAALGSYDIGGTTFATQFSSRGLGAAGA